MQMFKKNIPAVQLPPQLFFSVLPPVHIYSEHFDQRAASKEICS